MHRGRGAQTSRSERLRLGEANVFASTRGGGGIGVFVENEDDGRSVARAFSRTILASHRPEPKRRIDGATIYVSSVEEIRFIEEIPSNRKTLSYRK